MNPRTLTAFHDDAGTFSTSSFSVIGARTATAISYVMVLVPALCHFDDNEHSSEQFPALLRLLAVAQIMLDHFELRCQTLKPLIAIRHES